MIWLAQFFFSSADLGATMRHGLFHSPMIPKNTGLPCQAAASTRSERFEPGHTPVHAARASDAPREVHSGCAGCSFDPSSSAAANNGVQSGVVAGAMAVSFCGGIAWKYSKRPLASSFTLIIPEIVVG